MKTPIPSSRGFRALVGDAIFKLTISYTLILLMVSLLFSFSFYQVSVRELDTNYQAQARVLGKDRFLLDRNTQRSILSDLELDLQESKDRAFRRLVIANLIVLGGAVAFSYVFAKKTLQPIDEAHEAQARFTSDASHELRTPLAVMQTQIEVALRDPKLTKSEAVELLESAKEEVAELSDLTNNLLALSRNGLSEVIQIDQFDLKEVVNDAVGKAQKNKTKQIKINNKVAGSITVESDQSILKEMIKIVLDNATKFSSKPDITITSVKKSRHVDLAIKDNGIGLSKDQLDLIFDRFYRADSARSEQGHGLGLAIAKQLGDHVGVSITAQSAGVGEGSTFTLRVPKA